MMCRDDSSHLVCNEVNVSYHLLHITYTTRMHVMHNVFTVYHISANASFIVVNLIEQSRTLIEQSFFVCNLAWIHGLAAGPGAISRVA